RQPGVSIHRAHPARPMPLRPAQAAHPARPAQPLHPRRPALQGPFTRHRYLPATMAEVVMRYRSPTAFAGPIVESLEPRQLLAADPVTPDNPLWLIPRGDAVVDGVLNEPDWASAYEVFRTQPTRADSAVSIK